FEVSHAALEQALAIGDPVIEIPARHSAGYSSYFIADFPRARQHAEKGIAHYSPERELQVAATTQTPSTFACGNFLTLSLWFMGYPDQAEEARRRAWATIEELSVSACTAFALGSVLLYHYVRRDCATVAKVSQELCALANEEGYLFWFVWGRIFRGWA